MTNAHRTKRDMPTRRTRNPNLSTENQPEGAARQPSDTLDREPDRDPISGGAIPSNYDPAAMTRKGEQDDSRAAQDAVGRASRELERKND
ncbi:hypothetical protein [Sphingomonas bisphenolicum]|jgi:hypothetical protein|uniref:Uncharacterized protein n=1 Tax=Sphingomonas bisphenolicum TaxID=296544 RepID=A0ABM7G7B7_9SPHN|nr:hypothetical protein [Sphingomonas bisphenolicum]BBF70672.1 hypothetical protein SBA_ch1_28720 [Sphingomonas bisphenolicum]